MMTTAMGGFSDQDIDVIFNLPASVTDTNVRVMYEVIVARLRADFNRATLTTAQLLLIERATKNYCILRAKEDLSALEGGFRAFRDQLDMNKVVVGLYAEIDKVLERQDPNGRKEIIETVAEVLNSILLEDVTDPLMRRQIKNKLVARLGARNIT